MNRGREAELVLQFVYVKEMGGGSERVGREE